MQDMETVRMDLTLDVLLTRTDALILLDHAVKAYYELVLKEWNYPDRARAYVRMRVEGAIGDLPSPAKCEEIIGRD